MFILKGLSFLITIRVFYCLDFYIDNSILASGSGRSNDSPLKSIDEAFEKWSQENNKLDFNNNFILMNSKKEYFINNLQKLKNNLALKSENENIATIIIFQGFETDCFLQLLKLKIELNQTYLKDFVFILNVGSSLMINNSFFHPNNNISFKNFIFGFKTKIYLDSNEFSSFKNIYLGQNLIYGRETELNIFNCNFWNISTYFSPLIRIDNINSIIIIKNCFFSNLLLSKNELTNDAGSLIDTNGSNIFIYSSSFLENNFGFESMIYSSNSFKFYVSIYSCQFTRNRGYGQALIFYSYQVFFKLSLNDTIFLENNIEKIPQSALFYHFDDSYESQFIFKNFTCISNIGVVFYAEFIHSLFFDGFIIQDNNLAHYGTTLSNDYFAILIDSPEELTINNFMINNTISYKDIAGFLYRANYDKSYCCNLKKRMEQGEQIIHYFNNISYINIYSNPTYEYRLDASAFYFLCEIPIHSEFKSLKFLNNSNEYGNPCMVLWLNNDASLTMDSVIAENNKAILGGVCFAFNRVINGTLKNATISHNIPSSYKYNDDFNPTIPIGTRGPISVISSILSLFDCFFNENVAEEGGAIYFKTEDKTNIHLNIYNSSFLKNRASLGGVLRIKFFTFFSITIQITKNIFKYNEATSYGGALFIDYSDFSSHISIVQNIFGENQALKGSAIYFEHENFEINLLENIFYNNLARNAFLNTFSLATGAVLYLSENKVPLVSSQSNFYRNNTSNFKAGVVFIGKGVFNEKKSAYFNNTAKEIAGCFLMQNFGRARLENIFFENSMSLITAGILQALERTEIYIEHCFFFNSFALAKGGSFMITEYSLMEVRNSVFFNNIATEGGIFFCDSLLKTLNLINCSFLTMETQKNLISASFSFKIMIENSTLNNINCSFVKGFLISNLSILNCKCKEIKLFSSSNFLFELKISNFCFGGNQIENATLNYFNSLIYLELSKANFLESSFQNISGDSKGSCIFSLNSIFNMTVFTFKSVISGSAYLYGSEVYFINVIFDNRDLNITDPELLIGLELTDGSMIYAEKGVYMYINNCSFYGNNVSYVLTGGGIKIIRGYSDFSSSYIISTNFYYNRASHKGGAISIFNQKTILINCSFIYNSAEFGGAIVYETEKDFNDSSIFRNITFFSNFASKRGGCFYFQEKIPQFELGKNENNTAFDGNLLSSFVNEFKIKVYKTSSETKIDNPDLIFDSSKYDLSKPLNFDIYSGQISNILIQVDLIDSFNQKLTTLNEGFGRLSPLSSDSIEETERLNLDLSKNATFNYSFYRKEVNVFGDIVARNINGTFNFQNLIFYATPTTCIPIFLTNDALDHKLSNISSQNPHYLIKNDSIGVILILRMKECVPGQVYLRDMNMCSFCPESKYSFSPFDEKCSDCPKNAHCPGRNIILVDPGFWRSSNSSSTIYQCSQNKKACLGGLNSECKEGYEGPLCSLCSKANVNNSKIFTKNGNDCVECPNVGLNVFLGFIVIFVFFVIMLVVVKLYNHDESIVLTEKGENGTPLWLHLKILFEYVQLIAITQNIQNNSPDFYRQFSDAQYNSIFYVSSFVSFDCFISYSSDVKGESTLFIRILYISIIPIFVLMFSAIFWLLFYRIEKKKLITLKKDFFIHKFVSTTIITFFFMHPIMLEYMLKLLICQKIDKDYQLNADLSLHCYEGDHYFYVFLFSIPNLLIFSFGFPAYIWLKIKRDFEQPLSKENNKKYKFMYSGYREEFYDRGLIKMIQRTVIIIISSLPVEVGIKIIVIALILIRTLRSKNIHYFYDKKVLNDLEYLSYIVVLINLVTNIYFILSNNKVMEFCAFLFALLSNLYYICQWLVKLGFKRRFPPFEQKKMNANRIRSSKRMQIDFSRIKQKLKN